ncbi:MAG: hypothetical protein M1828_005331 [Chrysothrix sp. TS-e1954]|nr:MAG: hypothetical protein M1828_005331 [Chrysothrix sp. TS-e1954]
MATTSLFLNLPGEIRNIIYRLALDAGGEIRLTTPSGERTVKSECTGLSVARACNQTHVESRAMLLDKIVHLDGWPSVVERYTKALPPNLEDSIRSVTLRYWPFKLEQPSTLLDWRSELEMISTMTANSTKLIATNTSEDSTLRAMVSHFRVYGKVKHIVVDLWNDEWRTLAKEMRRRKMVTMLGMRLALESPEVQYNDISIRWALLCDGLGHCLRYVLKPLLHGILSDGLESGNDMKVDRVTIHLPYQFPLLLTDDTMQGQSLRIRQQDYGALLKALGAHRKHMLWRRLFLETREAWGIRVNALDDRADASPSLRQLEEIDRQRSTLDFTFDTDGMTVSRRA